MRLSDLQAHFTQILPLADGIFTGLYYVCPNDPRRKKGHGVLFDTIINPYAASPSFSVGDLMRYLNMNDGYRAQPKWHRTGETIDTLTLSPSIAFPCCHIAISNGEVYP